MPNVGPSWMLRATAAPARFFPRGFRGFVSRVRTTTAPARPAHAFEEALLPVRLPPDLVRFLTIVGGAPLGSFHPWRRTRAEGFSALVAGAQRTKAAKARLLAWLAGGVPFGTTRDGRLFVHMLGEPSSTVRDVVAVVSPETPSAPDVVCRGVAAFALVCALEEAARHGGEKEAAEAERARAKLPPPGVAEQEGVRAAFERAVSVLDLLCGTANARTRAIAKLGLRPLDVPPAERRPTGARARTERTAGLALGPLVEAFFRYDEPEFAAVAHAHEGSDDALVREASAALTRALARDARPSSKLAADLFARRTRTLRKKEKAPTTAVSSAARLALTRRIIDAVDRAARDASPHFQRREEALLALSELGDADIAESLVERAVKGDVDAVDMLGALGHAAIAPHLLGMLGIDRESPNARRLDAAVVRALGAIGDRHVAGTLRRLLAESPMTNWREGIARADLVAELTAALGTLRDEEAGATLMTVLEGRSQEYRAIAPTAAWALGRIAHLPALDALAHLLTSPNVAVTCEAIWAVGEIGARHAEAGERAGDVLASLRGLEPGAEMVRLSGLAKVATTTRPGPSTASLREAFERALWEPSFRREETAKRRLWALRAFADLGAAGSTLDGGTRTALAGVLDHEAVRYFVTLDDHRVREEAERAFSTWRLPVPKTRKYYAFLLEDLERQGGLEALHDALRDPLGVFRHNVATYLSDKGDPSSVGPLAEATARLFAEPPTSTYEYDDAPAHLVAFVQALARFNRPEGNAVLIDGLRTGHHHVRAVVAENAPDDPRFIPELMAMLGDTRSFLRSRAERSLAALGVRRAASDVPPLTVEG